jgi:hypothetical protein
MSGMIWVGLWSALSMLAPAGAQTAVPAGTAAQQDDDWEYVADPARSLTAASVRYEDGKAVVVQCAPAGLRVVVVGLPATTERTRTLAATRPGGRADTQTWFAEPGATAFTASVNGRDARFLRGGGLFELRSPAGSAAPIRADFDLPTQNANLDRVLTACGYAVTDERDALARTGDDLKTQWQVAHAEEIARGEHGGRGGRSPLNNSRSITDPGRRRSSAPPAPPSPPQPADLSCVVRAGALAECRFDHPPSGAPAQTERTLRILMETKLDQTSAAANEGRVYYPGPLMLMGTTTVIDYIGTIPAGGN